MFVRIEKKTTCFGGHFEVSVIQTYDAHEKILQSWEGEPWGRAHGFLASCGCTESEYNHKKQEAFNLAAGWAAKLGVGIKINFQLQPDDLNQMV